MRLIIILILNLVGLISCKQQVKFDKVKWTTKEFPEAPPQQREGMLQDLTTNYKLVGLQRNKVIDLLGSPDYANDTTLTYEITGDYGSDIDPVAGKYFDLILNKDTVVVSTKVREWHK
jgi:hypothetical protein